jgi:hypothetical protein
MLSAYSLTVWSNWFHVRLICCSFNFAAEEAYGAIHFSYQFVSDEIFRVLSNADVQQSNVD